MGEKISKKNVALQSDQGKKKKKRKEERKKNKEPDPLCNLKVFKVLSSINLWKLKREVKLFLTICRVEN